MNPLSIGLIAATTMLNTAAMANPDFYNPVTTYPAAKSVNAAGRIADITRFLVDQLAQNRDIKNISASKIAVVSVTSVDGNLQKPSKLGIVLAEHFMHELQVRGFKVIDFKLMPNVKIGSGGDFVLSRNVSELREQYDVQYALYGTYIDYRDGVLVNARLVNMKTSEVASTSMAFVPKNVMASLNSDYESSGRLDPIYVAPDVQAYSMRLKQDECSKTGCSK